MRETLIVYIPLCHTLRLFVHPALGPDTILQMQHALLLKTFEEGNLASLFLSEVLYPTLTLRHSLITGAPVMFGHRCSRIRYPESSSMSLAQGKVACLKPPVQVRPKISDVHSLGWTVLPAILSPQLCQCARTPRDCLLNPKWVASGWLSLLKIGPPYILLD